MRILFISDNFPPEVNAPASRTFEHCEEWVKAGVDVTVLTCFPNYPQGKVYAGFTNKLYQVEYIEGIKVVRLWSYMTKNEGFIKRILDYLSFAFMAFWAGLFKKTDIIIATSPQFFTTFSGCLLSVIKRKPWIFELRDLWPETIKAVSAMKDNRLLDFLEKIEVFLYQRCTKVIAVTDAFKSNLISRGVDGSKIAVITNGVNMNSFSPRSKNINLIDELGLVDKFIVGYIGTHGMSQGLDFIIRSAFRVVDDGIIFLFIGDGAEKKGLETLCKTLGLSNIVFHDPVSKEKIAEYISILDIALVPLKRRDTFKTVIPSKIFEMASMEKPILLGVEGQAQEIIEKYQAGICFEPENENDFIEKLLQVKNDKEVYYKLKEGCCRLAKDYDRKELALKMLNKLKEVIA